MSSQPIAIPVADVLNTIETAKKFMFNELKPGQVLLVSTSSGSQYEFTKAPIVGSPHRIAIRGGSVLSEAYFGSFKGSTTSPNRGCGMIAINQVVTGLYLECGIFHHPHNYLVTTSVQSFRVVDAQEARSRIQEILKEAMEHEGEYMASIAQTDRLQEMQ